MSGSGHRHRHKHHHQENSGELKNPRVPLTWQLGSLTEGLSIIIDGFAPHNSELFSINLQNGTANNETSDILLHLNPRFSQRQIVRNARFNGVWGSEEKQGGMGLTKNRRFVLQILVEHHQYSVKIDDKLYCTFGHRGHLGLANTLLCDGNMTLNKVSYRRAFNPQQPFPPVVVPTAPVYPSIPTGPPGGYPTGCVPPPYPGPGGMMPPPGGMIPPPYPGGAFPPAPAMPIVNPRMPLTTQIPGCLSLGRTVIVNCKIKPRASRFKINLQFGTSESDIALHFNPRYNPDGVVLNSKVRNEWGNEEKHPMPAGLSQKGANAEIRITLNAQDFHIFVNGVFMASYRHRVASAQPLDTLQIAEDCEVNSVSFI